MIPDRALSIIIHGFEQDDGKRSLQEDSKYHYLCRPLYKEKVPALFFRRVCVAADRVGNRPDHYVLHECQIEANDRGYLAQGKGREYRDTKTEGREHLDAPDRCP